MALIESRSIDYVPLAERHGKVWHLWPIWFTGDAHLATLATGALGIATGLDFFWSCVAILGGGALGTFFMAFHSTQGPELGLPQMIQSRPQFGYIGALLVWIVALITYIGYNAFNQGLAASTLTELAGIPKVPGETIFALIALGVAISGYDLIHKAQRWLAYLMMGFLLVYSFASIGIADWGALLKAGPLVKAPFLVQFFAAAAYQLSWSIYVSDYSRYLPKDVGVRESFLWTFGGAFVGGAWMMLVGAFAAALFGTDNIVASLRQTGDAMYPGFGAVMLATSFLGLITINALNFYGASLTLLSMVDSVHKTHLGVKARIVSLLMVFAAAIGLSLLSKGDILEQFEHFLSLLVYLFTPWTAINLVDFFFVRKGRYSIRAMFMPDGMYGRWSWRGLVSYAIGFGAMVPFFKTAIYTGPIATALGGADISMLIGLPVSAGAYLLACRSLDLEAEQARIPELDRNLETEPVR